MAVFLYNAHVLAGELAGGIDAAGVGDHVHLFAQAVAVGGHAVAFFCWVEPGLQLLIVGGDAGWTSVFVAAHGLNTAQREHEATGCNRKICPRAQRHGHCCRGDAFAGDDDADAIAQPVLAQDVIDHGQSFVQAQAYVVHERHRGCA